MHISSKAGLIVILALLATTASADFSTNIGWASDYYYRGVFQKTSSANGGLDYSKNGFYVGTWAADVGDGLEVDGYIGYGGEISEFTYGVGFTGYYYTGDFDDTYEEVNLSAGYSFLTLDYAVGRYQNFTGSSLDYNFYSVTFEYKGFYGKYAGFSQDFSGEYFEAGYGTTVADIDLGLSLIVNDKDLNVFSDSDGDETLIFTIGKSFDIQ
jgi:uncharacterized protein (TIGR02001 family)